jgi:hypothetical protein
MLWLTDLPSWVAFILIVGSANVIGGKPDQHVVDSLFALQHAAKPRAPEYASDLYHQLETLVDARYQRWESASASTPNDKIALCIVALTVFVVLAIALPDRLDTHIVLTVLIATAIGSVFWVMVALSYPYCGSYYIGPKQIVSAAAAY